MINLLEKLSSYELPNMIIPGSLLSALLCWIFRIDVAILNTAVGIFVFICTAYVLGLVASRFGSLIIEPVAKSCNFIQWTDYANYCKAETKDQKISVLMSYMNLYRTLSSAGIIMIIGLVYESTKPTTIPVDLMAWLCLLFSFLFLISYKKQAAYAVKRVESVVGRKKK